MRPSPLAGLLAAALLLAGAALCGPVPAAGAAEGKPTAPSAAIGAGAGVPAPRVAPAGMAYVPAGMYRPLYRPSQADPQPGQQAAAAADEVPVAAYFLDVYAVTNADYVAFLRAQPRWQRSRVPHLFVDEGYLSAWAGDLEPGPQAPPDRPVVRVSWFAARAFCKWRGRQLPTIAQWERAAAATETQADGHADPAFEQRILEWYGRPTPSVPAPVGSTFRNLWGIYDLHGLVWEWTRDFNTALVTGESRGDSGVERSLFCAAGSVGAADPGDYAAFMRFAFRSSLRGDYTASSLGFRCALPAP